jgi:hypothetical protein
MWKGPVITGSMPASKNRKEAIFLKYRKGHNALDSISNEMRDLVNHVKVSGLCYMITIGSC